MAEKTIEYNAAIFPYIMSLSTKSDDGLPECSIELPRYACELYLSGLTYDSNKRELEVFEKYAYGMTFTDQDYSDIIDFALIPVQRNEPVSAKNILEQFGIVIKSDKERNWFELDPDMKDIIRANTWDCIIVDCLREQYMDVINCFDFIKNFERNAENEGKLRIHLGSYRFTADEEEQKLSNALRTAFFFTLIGYKFNLRLSQYSCFEDYFENEYYKRVSLVYAIWNCRKTPEDIRYIPLYDSFINLSPENKADLVNTLKAILDSDFMALDDKDVLKEHLVEGCNEVHSDPAAYALEQSLIKPAMNYIMLREKSKETMESAISLYNDKHYKDCANRCYYAMLFMLKALLEDQGLLSDWKTGELKEPESHSQLENKLKDLVSTGVLAAKFQNDFNDVKDARWGCDYSIMTFVEADARMCIQKMKDFCAEAERLTTR